MNIRQQSPSISNTFVYLVRSRSKKPSCKQLCAHSCIIRRPLVVVFRTFFQGEVSSPYPLLCWTPCRPSGPKPWGAVSKH